ncbi:FtsX-like permease family protein [Flavobacteriaceae bacterium F89]|uniref:FtsX-like permease family protein n=1 Tax=Cerina litoralis TaxID=2874477 RepID=A0AAE3JRC3_9FLAO|nr:FtsX-like permease family protein [Cerina litoralis]MCG2459497.1 FtsX-like permease family protein [Cerina litoralis]
MTANSKISTRSEPPRGAITRLAFHLAYKNLMGAGLRTWLSVGILSFVFVLIIFYQGYVEGFYQNSIDENIAWEYGGGQLLYKDYDPYDAFTLQDGHGKIPATDTKDLVPILIRQASIYPQGRLMPVLVKGIEVAQNTVKLPTQLLQQSSAEYPVIIGKRMAASVNLKKGDQVMLRWRDKNGSFDAGNVTIAGIFDTDVPNVDIGQIWMPLKKLWAMTDMKGQATLFIANNNYEQKNLPKWKFKTQDELLTGIRALEKMDKITGVIIYLVLLAIAMLAVFDTQVLSIFRRQQEIGTYISLGMTRKQVLGLFTAEGCMHSILGVLVGFIYGVPIFIYFTRQGIGTPAAVDNLGISAGKRIFPDFSPELIIGTAVLIIVSTTIVSFLPARKIAKMNPVDALKGKLQ